MFSYLSQCATTDDNVFRSGGLPPIRRYLTSSLPTPRTLAIRIERRFSPDLAFPASLSPLQYESRIREISEAEARNEPGLRSETGNGPAPPSGRHLPAFRPGRPPTPQLSRLLETHRPRFLALGDQPLPVSFVGTGHKFVYGPTAPGSLDSPSHSRVSVRCSTAAAGLTRRTSRSPITRCIASLRKG